RGADSTCVPGGRAPRAIAALAERLACPVTVPASPGPPPLAELARLGVARISLGSGAMRAAMTLVERMTEEALTKGTFSALEGALPHATLNAWMQERRTEAGGA